MRTRMGALENLKLDFSSSCFIGRNERSGTSKKNLLSEANAERQGHQRQCRGLLKNITNKCNAIYQKFKTASCGKLRHELSQYLVERSKLSDSVQCVQSGCDRKSKFKDCDKTGFFDYSVSQLGK